MTAPGSILSRHCEAPRSYTRALLDRLKFNTPDNAAESLRVIAELARTEAVSVDVSRVGVELIIGVRERNK